MEANTPVLHAVYEICLLHGCESGYTNVMLECNVMVKGRHCQEIAGDNTVSTGKA